MRCSQFKNLISVYVDNELDDRRRRKFEEHLANCSDCSALVKSYQDQVFYLNQIFDSAAHSSPCADGLAASVIARIESERMLPESAGRMVRHPVLAFSGMFAAVAVALLLLVHTTMGSLSDSELQVVSGKRFTFTVKPSQDGRVDAGLYAMRYARIDSRKSGWKR